MVHEVGDLKDVRWVGGIRTTLHLHTRDNVEEAVGSGVGMPVLKKNPKIRAVATVGIGLRESGQPLLLASRTCTLERMAVMVSGRVNAKLKRLREFLPSKVIWPFRSCHTA